ncbi:glycosyltransferase family 9 protein [Bdellovibrionota bacterium FG-1]
MKKTILVRAPNWIGDQVLTYPFFYYLRKANPQARIVVACVAWVEAIQFRDLVDDVYVLPRSIGTGLRARFEAVAAAARELRAEVAGRGEWDEAYCLPHSLSAAWLVFRAGAKIRRGYGTDARGVLLKPAISWEKRKSTHRAEDYVGLLPPEAQPTGLPVRGFWGVPPENELDPGSRGEMERFDALVAWPGAEPLDPPSGEYWIMAPGSQAPSRRWPLSQFAELARQVFFSTGWRGVIVGGPGEAPLARELVSDRSLGLLDMTALGSVASNWRLFAGARFTVTNDSGLAHVAALCGSPTQVVWGAGDPKRTEPLGPGKVRILFNPVECWPCERNQCALSAARQIECLRGIQASQVWKEIQSGLRPR